MTLSDVEIKRLLASAEMSFTPDLEEEQIQPASVDLRLGNQFKLMRPTNTPIDSRKGLQDDEDTYQTYNVRDGLAFEIPPMTFVLATTKDYMKLPANIGGTIHGRSSVGRMGLFTENAGWVDPGFEGEITLELFNASPRSILVYPGDRMCQIELVKTDQLPENEYNGKYQGQTGATVSAFHKDFTKGV